MSYGIRSTAFGFFKFFCCLLFFSISSFFASAQLPGIEWGTYYDIENSVPGAYFLSDEELIDQIAIDTSGPADVIYVVGRTSSINKNSQGNSWQNDGCASGTITTGQKAPAAFLAKYNSSGTLLWSRFIGTDEIYSGFYSTFGYCLALDHVNDETIIYVAGEITNALAANSKAFGCDVCNDRVYDSLPDDNDEGFIAKYNQGGDLLRWTFVGGTDTLLTSSDQVLSIDVHPTTHDVYITGYTESSNFGSSGQQTGVPYYDNTLAGKGDVFIASFNSCLKMTWFTYYGGTGIQNQQKQNLGQDRGHCIKIFHNSTDNFFAVSATVESKSLAVNASYDNLYGGISSTNEDAFLMKWDIGNLSAGPAWADYLGAESSDRGRGIAFDGSGNIFWTGRTSSSGLAYPSSCSSNLAQAIKGDKEDAFIAKFTKNGKAKWVTYFGGNGDEEVNGIAYYSPSCLPALVIITGLTSSTNLLHIPASYPHSSLNGSGSTQYDDAFVAAVEDRDVCSMPQAIKFSTYLGGKADEHNHSSLSYGPDVKIGRNMYVSFSTKSRLKQMLDGATTINGTYNNGCCGGLTNTDAFIEKFYPFDLCRESSPDEASSSPSPLTCYPSPFTESTICKIISSKEENSSILILDIYGNIVQKRMISLSEGVNEISLDLTQLSKGIYFVKTTINGEIQVRKIVKQ